MSRVRQHQRKIAIAQAIARAGLTLGLKPMTDRGWEADLCLVSPNERAGKAVERHLAAAHYAGVVIGAGIRLPPQSLALFEAVVNAVHQAAPHAALRSISCPKIALRPPPVGCRPDEHLPDGRHGVVSENYSVNRREKT